MGWAMGDFAGGGLELARGVDGGDALGCCCWRG